MTRHLTIHAQLGEVEIALQGEEKQVKDVLAALKWASISPYTLPELKIIEREWEEE